MRKLKRSRILVVLSAVGVIAAASVGVAVAGEKITTSGSGSPKVYEGELGCCQVILLPTTPTTTTIVNSPPVAAAGKYLVHFQTFVVMGPAPSGTAENVGCNAKDPASPEGVGDVAGNGATESPEKPNLTGNGVYGNVTAEGVVPVLKAGDHIELACNSGQGTQGSYIASAVIDATKVGTLVKDVQP